MSVAGINEAERNARYVKAPAVPTNGEPPQEGSSTPDWVRNMQSWQPAPNRFRVKKPDVKYAVQGLIRAGKVGALVAAGGTGKTTLLLILAVCHATGREFFGLEVMVGTFVLLSNDDPLEDLEVALDAVIREMHLSQDELTMVNARVRLHSLQGEAGLKTFTSQTRDGILATGLEELILEAVRGISDLVGIAIDTLRQFSGGSSNDELVIIKTIAGATEIALRTGAYVALPHHTGKQNYRDGIADMYCGSGSAAIADNCRFVLLLQAATWPEIESKVRRTGQERGDPLVLSSTRGSLLVKPMEPIFLHRQDFYIGRLAGAVMTRDQQADERDRKVLRAVRAGAQTKNAIWARVKGRKQDVLARVDDLEGRGLLLVGSQSGSGKRPEYTVSTAGGRFLDEAES